MYSVHIKYNESLSATNCPKRKHYIESTIFLLKRGRWK